MDPYLQSRILELIRESPGGSAPLHAVHGTLTAEFGVRAGTLAELRERLRAQPGAVLLIEPENPLGDGLHWPAAARTAYEAALRAAGLDTGPWLTVVADPPEPDPDFPTAVIRASLLDLLRTTASRPALRDAIARTLAELNQNGRPPA